MSTNNYLILFKASYVKDFIFQYVIWIRKLFWHQGTMLPFMSPEESFWWQFSIFVPSKKKKKAQTENSNIKFDLRQDDPWFGMAFRQQC